MFAKKKLKVLTLSAFSGVTGAGIAFERIVNAQRSFSENVITSQSLLDRNDGPTPNIMRRKFSTLRWRFQRYLMRPLDGHFLSPFITSAYVIKDTYDIIHLHWHGFGSLPDPNAFSNIPVVITHHDHWWFTGGCHYPLDCPYQKTKCQTCPSTHGQKNLSKSIAIKDSFLQRRNWHNIFVSEDQKSKTQAEGFVIGNVVPDYPHKDINQYQESKIYDLIYVAAAFNSDQRKGFKRFIDIIINIPVPLKIMIVGDALDFVLHDKLNSIHDVNNELSADKETLDDLMSASKICIITSIDETFGQVSCEAAANFCIPLGQYNTAFETIFQDFDCLMLCNHSLRKNVTKITRLLASSDNYGLAKRLHSHVSKNFSGIKIARAYDVVYRSVNIKR